MTEPKIDFLRRLQDQPINHFTYACDSLKEVPDKPIEKTRKPSGLWFGTFDGKGETNPFKLSLRECKKILAGKQPDQPDALEVGQGQYAVFKLSHKRYLQSPWASLCVILTLYDSTSNIGMVLHADMFTKIEDSINRILQTMEKSGARLTFLEARMFSGFGDPDIIAHIKDSLRKRGIIIVEQNTETCEPSGASIMLDLATGKACPYTETITTAPHEEIRKKIMRSHGTVVASKHPDSL